jgi:hypothetical protein
MFFLLFKRVDLIKRLVCLKFTRLLVDAMTGAEVNVFCPVCLDAFQAELIPKFLKCGHSVCLTCATVLTYNNYYFKCVV